MLTILDVETPQAGRRQRGWAWGVLGGVRLGQPPGPPAHPPSLGQAVRVPVHRIGQRATPSWRLWCLVRLGVAPRGALRPVIHPVASGRAGRYFAGQSFQMRSFSSSVTLRNRKPYNVPEFRVPGFPARIGNGRPYAGRFGHDSCPTAGRCTLAELEESL